MKSYSSERRDGLGKGQTRRWNLVSAQVCAFTCFCVFLVFSRGWEVAHSWRRRRKHRIINSKRCRNTSSCLILESDTGWKHWSSLKCVRKLATLLELRGTTGRKVHRYLDPNNILITWVSALANAASVLFIREASVFKVPSCRGICFSERTAYIHVEPCSSDHRSALPHLMTHAQGNAHTDAYCDCCPALHLIGN